jgi:cellulose synthase/poly-beta-1,6-N-acetylglucosamine synthase-like glycosyltransferase
VNARLVFWISAGVVLYAYVGYPILVWILQWLFPRPVRKKPIEPSVSLVVAAYNEARVIERKIGNALELDYPAQRLEIIIASDGSDDATAELARGAAAHLEAGDRVRVLAYPVNRGKLAVLNETVPQVRGDIVVFSDASSMLAPDAIRHLVANFADPRVGAASGIYRVRKQEESRLGVQEDFYWQYETFLKRQESRLGVVLGAHGSLYAIRRALYPFPSPGLINDDYIIPLRIIHQGYRVAYELDAVAFEEASEMGGFGRRVRIMTGNFEQLREIVALLWPPRWLALFVFLSHKAGRLFAPFAMLAGLLANALLIRDTMYFGTACLQGVFYALALIGAALPLRPKALRLPHYFCMINLAAFPGLYHAIRGGRRLAWKRPSAPIAR